MEAVIKQSPSAKIDYIAVADTKYLKSITSISGEALIALAVFVGKTRLIDNTIVKV
jgi:pantoate--beta-alanine ligase